MTSRPTARRSLFDGRVCRACGRTDLRRTAAHGLAHVRRGEATATSDPYCPSTSGHRYLFWLPEGPKGTA